MQEMLTAKSWGLTADGWYAESPRSRALMMATDAVVGQMEAWEGLSRKEKRRILAQFPQPTRG